MNELYLIPKSGVNVRDPLTGKPLPAEGAPKPRSSYWLRRLRDGDVRQGKAPPSAAGKPSRAAAAATTPTTKGEAK